MRDLYARYQTFYPQITQITQIQKNLELCTLYFVDVADNLDSPLTKVKVQSTKL